ncbi:hypothetical protein L9F63_009458, partial [Diploptera punctata]
MYIMALFVMASFICISAQEPSVTGTRCTSDADCGTTGNGFVCTDNVCSCQSGSVPNDSGTQCYATVNNDGSCIHTIQCNYSINAECTLGYCKCKPEYKFNGTTCIGNLSLGDACKTDAECVVQNDPYQKTVWCYNAQCACRSGYIREDTNRCVIGEQNALATVHLSQQSTTLNVFQLPRKWGMAARTGPKCTANLGKADCLGLRCTCESGVRENNDRTKC